MLATEVTETLQPQSANLIADYILSYDSTPFTMLHIMKLVYISHGWHLAVLGKPLILDEIEAWKYGPVIPSLYRTLKSYGREYITSLSYCGTSLNSNEIDKRKEFIQSRIHKLSRELIDRVIKEYSKLSAMQLSSLTHQNGTPWSQCYKDDVLFKKIPNSVIQKHYVQLAKDKLLD